MRTLAQLAALAWLTLLAAAAGAGEPQDTPALPRVVVAFANEPHSAPGPAGTTGSHYAGGGYRVSQSAQLQAQRVARTYALRPVLSWPIDALSMHCVVYEITDGRAVGEVLARLALDKQIVLAQPLQEFHTLTGPDPQATYNDPLYDMQTNLTTLGIARAHERAQGAGLRVALIDTAVDGRHPDLAGRIVRSHTYIATPASEPALQRHGTAMAGVIAAVANNHIGIVGIAPLAQIEVFEACWQLRPDADAAACNTFTLAKAIAGALTSDSPLVNLSIAGPDDPLLSALVTAGLRRGITFVGASAGTAGGFPSDIPGVIAATGTERPAPSGAFAAPSEHVMTLRPGAQYDFASGGSVATAELTGVIALLMSASRTHLASETVVSLLRDGTHTTNTADPAPVDVNAALARLDA
ncbi:MAG TPA: S8 family serine peptidase, partial [Steroidobacteraceae bacterium]|nr:S8 family serine peptidase [Steroidobacteraceae bacterium]